MDAAAEGRIIFEWDSDDQLAGLMDYDELKKITAGVLELPESDGVKGEVKQLP